MHDLVQVKQNKSLQEMLFIKNTILNNIYDNEGEITDQEDNELIKLDVTLPAKVDAWAWMLMNNGGIDKEVDLLVERKKAIDELIQKLKATKDRLKLRANDILRQNGLERIDGNNFWFKRDVSRTSRVIMSKVEDEYKTYELPKLSFSEYQQLKDIISHYLNASDTKYILGIELARKIKEGPSESCGVKNLPNSHIAIEYCENPTLRIFVKK